MSSMKSWIVPLYRTDVTVTPAAASLRPTVLPLVAQHVKEVFDGLQAQLAANRSEFYRALPEGPFYGGEAEIRTSLRKRPYRAPLRDCLCGGPWNVSARVAIWCAWR